jgi:hypothetical protein
MSKINFKGTGGDIDDSEGHWRKPPFVPADPGNEAEGHGKTRPPSAFDDESNDDTEGHMPRIKTPEPKGRTRPPGASNDAEGHALRVKGLDDGSNDDAEAHDVKFKGLDDGAGDDTVGHMPRIVRPEPKGRKGGLDDNSGTGSDDAEGHAKATRF